ncbi:MAG: SpoIID/LytB domain-containing protein [Deltaproteobacteria bacterium]|nr:SpoIID/LytB domain-containing protein [Deltaproteobacteria bacterium]
MTLACRSLACRTLALCLTVAVAAGALSCRHAPPVDPESPASVKSSEKHSGESPQPVEEPAVREEAVPRQAEPPSSDPRGVEPVPAPASESADAALPRLVRVGLATDLEEVTFPCCDSGVTARLGRFDLTNTAPLRIEPAFSSDQRGFFRLQVSALKDEGQAQQLALRLEGELSQPVDSRFDAESGLYKVRVGRYSTREEAELGKRSLEALGLLGSWVISEGAGLAEPAMKVRQGGKAYLVHGRWVTLLKAGDTGVSYGSHRYRGKLGVFLNDRGRLNVINEVPLEEYLRGVVPKEMGPLVYNEEEALKAQAVAARTYTVFHLGEHAAEGYDICATPRCHVYGGVTAEHPITDRILEQTTGQVVAYGNSIADTLYTASCGGHTEDVEVVFPTLLDRPYLDGVRCGEAGPASLQGGQVRGLPFPAAVTSRVFPSAAGAKRSGEKGAEVFEQRLLALASRVDLPAPRDGLDSLRRGEIRRFVASAFDLALDPRLLARSKELEQRLRNPPASWGAESLRQASYLAETGLFSGGDKEVLPEVERENLLFQLAQLLYVLKATETRFLDLEDGQLKYRNEHGTHLVELPAGVPTFRRQRGELSTAPLRLVAGDKLSLIWQGDRLEALVQPVEPRKAGFDRRNDRAVWTRFHSDTKLGKQVQERYPGLGFQGFEVLSQGDSGRVGKIRLLGNGGRSVEVEGLAVRWTLDVPETLFTASRQKPRGRAPGWLFRGRGWGHGVGMCQEGAFGMAQRGHSYQEILSHYYPGTGVQHLHDLARTSSVKDAGP